MGQFGPTAGVFDVGQGPTELDRAMMETGRVPVSTYTSRERFEQERALFGRIWLNVARVEEVAEPGDWIVRDIHCRSASILIARGKDSTLKAFHNICAHRGMKLVWETKGNYRTFTCPYHAWSYGLDGALRAIPDEGCFPDVDKGQSGLRPIAIDVWEGFVFINLDPEPAQTLIEFMGPLADRLPEAPFGDFPCTVTMTEMLDANWKLALEAQSEGYHISALHARTVRTMSCHTANPYVHPLNWEGLGPHRTYSSPRNPAFETTPAKAVQHFAFTSANPLIANSADGEVSSEKSFLDHGGFNPAKAETWGSDQILIWPHVALNAGLNGWWMHRFWPVAPDRTWWEAIYFFRKPTRMRERFALEYAMAFNRDTLSEDSVALRAQQAVMASGAMPFIQFGEQEVACRHLSAVTEAAVSASPIDPLLADAAE